MTDYNVTHNFVESLAYCFKSRFGFWIWHFCYWNSLTAWITMDSHVWFIFFMNVSSNKLDVWSSNTREFNVKPVFFLHRWPLERLYLQTLTKLQHHSPHAFKHLHYKLSSFQGAGVQGHSAGVVSLTHQSLRRGSAVSREGTPPSGLQLGARQPLG